MNRSSPIAYGIRDDRRTAAYIWGMVLACCCFLGLACAQGQSLSLREYDLKGALLFNIAKYIDWHKDAFSGPNEPIVIGVLGEDPFGEALDQIVRGRFIDGHPIAIRRATGIAGLKGAHVVFICPSENRRVAEECAILEDSHILTVGDTDITAAYAAVNFSIERDKVVFTVNLTRSSRIGAISSKLLRLAKVVDGSGDDSSR